MLSAHRLALAAALLALLPPAATAQSGVCTTLRNVIASGDAFNSIRGQELHANDELFRLAKIRDWASVIELPGSSAPARITEQRGEAMFTAELGTWAFEDFFALSPQQHQEVDERFVALKGALLACFPAWTRAKDVEWRVVLIGPTHALELAVRDADGQHFSRQSNEAAVVKLRVRPKASAQRLLEP